MIAHVIALPTAAMEPVSQRPRRGRYPAIVTPIRRGYLIKMEAQSKAEQDTRAQRAMGLAEGYRLGLAEGQSAGTPVAKDLAEAEKFYATAERILQTAAVELQAARQRAGKIGGAT